MRFLRVLIVVVAGLIVCGIVVDSYGARVPIRDIGIPIYLGDPDNVDHSRPRGGNGAGSIVGLQDRYEAVHVEIRRLLLDTLFLLFKRPIPEMSSWRVFASRSVNHASVYRQRSLE